MENVTVSEDCSSELTIRKDSSVANYSGVEATLVNTSAFLVHGMTVVTRIVDHHQPTGVAVVSPCNPERIHSGLRLN